MAERSDQNGVMVGRRQLLTIMSSVALMPPAALLLSVGASGQVGPPICERDVQQTEILQEVQEINQLQFPLVDARDTFKSMLRGLTMPVSVRNSILQALNVELDAIETFSVANIIKAFFNFKCVIDNSALGAVVGAAVVGAAYTLFCYLFCPAQPRNPPPGKVCVLIAWLPLSPFNGEVECFYLCV